MHHLEIRKLGPIQFCSFDINRFTVLTGPQASGKSTIAKAIYFYRTVKDDILDIMLKVQDKKPIHWESTLKKRLRDKFLRIYGSSWAMSNDMTILYQYSPQLYIKVYLVPSRNPGEPNFVEFQFSPNFEDYLRGLDEQIFLDISSQQKEYEISRLNHLFDDEMKTIFVPAGRSLITLLSNQLNFILNTMDEAQRRQIDYCTQSYLEQMLRVRTIFTSDMAALLSDKLTRTEEEVNIPLMKLFISSAHDILKGTYRYVDGEERLYLDNGDFVKINFVSSGQQDVVWALNILFYYLLEGIPTYLIYEEPESHLYPDTQRQLADLIGLFTGQTNNALITTHSPYLLGAFNNLLYSSQLAEKNEGAVNAIIKKPKRLPYKDTSAYFVFGSEIQQGLNEQGLIKNELIDGASQVINNDCDRLFDVEAEMEGWA